jgi:hypothetical protein
MVIEAPRTPRRKKLLFGATAAVLALVTPAVVAAQQSCRLRGLDSLGTTVLCLLRGDFHDWLLTSNSFLSSVVPPFVSRKQSLRSIAVTALWTRAGRRSALCRVACPGLASANVSDTWDGQGRPPLDPQLLGEMASARVYVEVVGGDGKAELRSQLEPNGAMGPVKSFVARLATTPGADSSADASPLGVRPDWDA